jgi:hypothetical protein
MSSLHKKNMYLTIQPPAMFVLLVFRKSGVTKICLFIEDTKFTVSHRLAQILYSPQYFENPTSLLKKRSIQIKLAGMSTSFHCTYQISFV